MNRDATGITSATDAAAPAVAPTAEPLTPAEPFPALAVSGPGTPLADIAADDPISDVVELGEHYETDAELAEFAVEQLNRAIAAGRETKNRLRAERPVGSLLLDNEIELTTRQQAHVATHILISRALMRSAAAAERQAAAAERSERHAADRRAQYLEQHELSMKVARLQLSAIEGDVARLRLIASLAFDFAAGLKDAPLAEGDNGLSAIRLVPNDARCFVQKLELLAAQLTPGMVA